MVKFEGCNRSHKDERDITYECTSHLPMLRTCFLQVHGQSISNGATLWRITRESLKDIPVSTNLTSNLIHPTKSHSLLDEWDVCLGNQKISHSLSPKSWWLPLVMNLHCPTHLTPIPWLLMKGRGVDPSIRTYSWRWKSGELWKLIAIHNVLDKSIPSWAIEHWRYWSTRTHFLLW